ncbi:MAG: hypothetical protein R3F36_10345 [Candidatus Competibacteraceae bacterium]
MLTKTPKTTYLKDYAPPAYRLPTIDLHFELGEDFTTVRSHLRVESIDAISTGTPLVLDGQQLELIALELDGAPLAADRYRVEEERLTLFAPASIIRTDGGDASGHRTTFHWKVCINQW